jgi:hypothetical protein
MSVWINQAVWKRLPSALQDTGRHHLGRFSEHRTTASRNARRFQPRWRVCSRDMLARSPMMGVDAWCATVICPNVRSQPGSARSRCVARGVHDRVGKGSDRIRLCASVEEPGGADSDPLGDVQVPQAAVLRPMNPASQPFHTSFVLSPGPRLFPRLASL